MKKGTYLRYIHDFCIQPKYIIKYLVLIIFIIASAFISAVQPKVQGEIIDGVGAKKDSLLFYVFFLLIIVFSGYAISAIKTLMTKIIAEELAAKMRTYICRKLIRIDTKYFQNVTYSELLTKSEKDVEEIKECGIVGIIFIMSNIVNICVCVPFMLRINKYIGAISLLFILLLPVVNFIFKNKIENVAARNLGTYRKYNDQLSDVFNNWKNIRLFGCNEYVNKRFEKSNFDYMKSGTDRIKVYIANDLTNTIVQLLGLSTIWILGIQGVIRGNLSIGNLLAMVTYQATISAPISTITSYISDFRISKVAIKDLYDFLDYTDESCEGLKLQEIDKIEINNINFNYGDGVSVLSDISFTFEKGNIYAITGRSGVGKSTLIDVLSGINKEYSGEILVNNIDLKKYNIKEYREQIAYLQQTTSFFQDTIYNNIVLERNIVNDDMENLCSQLGIRDEIKEMKDSWDTILHRNAGNISVGQAKRVDVVRNMFQQKSVYIFDETTASIDEDGRRKFYSIVQKIAENTIVILITHNSDELKYANYIYSINSDLKDVF